MALSLAGGSIVTLDQFSQNHITPKHFPLWLGNVANCQLPEGEWCRLLTEYYSYHLQTNNPVIDGMIEALDIEAKKV